MTACIALTRRDFARSACAGGLALALAPRARATSVSPSDDRLEFTIIRNGSTIGSHVLQFEKAGDSLTVHIDVQMRVGFGPISFFRYHHQGQENWRNDRFVSLDTQTDNDGEALSVHAKRVGDQIHVEATGLAAQSLPGDTLPLTHWNIACMHSPLFNPQDGKLFPVTTQPLGRESVALANGTQVQATRFSLACKNPIEDWYDNRQVWTALRARVKDGSTLHYLRQV